MNFAVTKTSKPEASWLTPTWTSIMAKMNLVQGLKWSEMFGAVSTRDSYM